MHCVSSARPGRRHACRRCGGRFDAHGSGRILCRHGPSPRATTIRRGQAGRSTGTAMASCSAKEPVSWCSRKWSTPGGAGQPSMPNCSEPVPAPTPITLPPPIPKGSVPSKPCGWPWKMPGLNPADVSYLNAHGTSTQVGDECETLAIKHVFGEHAHRLAISSTKSMTGHLFGAAGGVELIATALTIRDGVVHPTINSKRPIQNAISITSRMRLARCGSTMPFPIALDSADTTVRS